MTNPTSNYSFQMPTAIDLVTDLPADFEVFGQAVDTRLKALQPGTTLGDLAFSSATANTNTRLGIGSAAQVLTVAGGVPTWAAPAAGGGKVLQVVSATTTTTTSIATTSFTDTTITATITPTSATSKILVLLSYNYIFERGASGLTIGGLLLRDATTIADYTNPIFLGLEATGATLVQNRGIGNLSMLDSPATTSATTYKLQSKLATTANSAVIIFQPSNGVNAGPSFITLMEIGA